MQSLRVQPHTSSSSSGQQLHRCQRHAASNQPHVPGRGHHDVCRAVQQPAPLAREVQQQLEQATKVVLSTGSNCQLAVSRYPMFSYNAAGGGGMGAVQRLAGGDASKLRLHFDAQQLRIPDLNWRTASVFGVPIPPPLNIAIRPSKFEGTLDLSTGQLELEFAADFNFTVGSLYAAPSLKVATTLTTERSAGQIHSANGQRLQGGAVKLVGVARVPAEGTDTFLRLFLMLPTDALAVMRAQLAFS